MRKILTAVCLVALSAALLGACSSSDDSAAVSAPDGSSTDGTATDGATTDGTTTDGATTDGTTTDGATTTGTTTTGTTTDGEQQPVTGTPATSANYRLTFTSTWSAATHPVNFPAGPHFSGLVGAVHNAQVVLWERGAIATDGIELMAETGGKSTLLTEVQSAIASGYAAGEISGGGVAESPGSVSVEFSVSVDNPLVSVVSMLAPSPDWFVGVNSLALYRDGAFIEQETVDLRLYDAGTDSGLQYASGNAETSPRGTITRLTAEPADAPFVDGLPGVGQFVFEKLP